MNRLLSMPLTSCIAFCVLLTACGGGSDSSALPVGAENPFGDGIINIPGTAASDLNESSLLIVQSKGELYKLEALTGESELLFDFGINRPIGPADVIEGVAYITADDNSINAIDLASGSFLWDVFLGERSSRLAAPTPAVCDDQICYARGNEGVLYAIDTQSQRPIWQTPLHPDGTDGGALRGTPLLVTGDKIYLGVHYLINSFANPIVNPRLIVVDRASGNVLQNVDFEWALTGVPAVTGNTIVVSTANQLYAIDAETMQVKWQSQENINTTTALVMGTQVIFNYIDKDAFPFDHSTISLNLVDGAPLWTSDAGRDDFIFTPSTDGQRLYTSDSRYFACQSCKSADAVANSLSDGSRIWTRAYAIQETPLAVSGYLFYDEMQVFEDDLAGFGAVDAESGELIWLTEQVRFSFGDFVLVQNSNYTFRRTDYPDVQP